MKLATLLILIHAIFGGIGLLSGIVSMSSKKGNKTHRNFGKLFVYSMLSSSVLCIPVCFIPGHESMFLFAIAVLTIYLVLSGQRALLFKIRNLPNIQLWKDWLISSIMFIFGMALVMEAIFGYFNPDEPKLLFYFFGTLSMYLAVQDFRFFKQKEKTAVDFIHRHIGQMSGAFIASFTAFLTAGLKFNHWLFWTLPTVFIFIWINYWIKKYSLPKKTNH